MAGDGEDPAAVAEVLTISPRVLEFLRRSGCKEAPDIAELAHTGQGILIVPGSAQNGGGNPSVEIVVVQNTIRILRKFLVAPEEHRRLMDARRAGEASRRAQMALAISAHPAP